VTRTAAAVANLRPLDPRLLRHSRSSRGFLLVCVLHPTNLAGLATAAGRRALHRITLAPRLLPQCSQPDRRDALAVPGIARTTESSRATTSALRALLC